jgi:hypothetical protein
MLADSVVKELNVEPELGKNGRGRPFAALQGEPQ